MSSTPPPPAPLHSQEAPPPSASDKVPLREKLAYGVGSLGGALQSGTDDRLLLPIFVNTLHVSPALMSSIPIFYRIWDAITDMLVGWASDNTRSRWGRRRPYLLVGTILSAAALPIFWTLNPEWELRTIILWMIGGQLLLFLANTIWNIPYQSLLFEITPSSVERTNVAAVRSYFGMVAALPLAWMWWLTLLPIFNDAEGQPDTIKGAIWVSVAIGIIVLICGGLTTYFCQERYYHAAAKTEKIALWPNIKMTLSNRPFQILTGMLLLFVFGTYIANNLIFYVRLYFISGGDATLASELSGWGGTIEVVTGIAGIPLVQWFARRFGKRATLIGVMSLVGLTGMSTWFTYTPTYPYLSLLNNFISAPVMSAIWILFPSMTSDIVDDEELKNGTRREGAFAAIFSWIFKLALTIASAMTGFFVVWVGFDAAAGAQQAEGVMLAIRLILVFSSGIAVAIAVALGFFYPLTSRRIEEIRAELEARRGVL